MVIEWVEQVDSPDKSTHYFRDGTPATSMVPSPERLLAIVGTVDEIRDLVTGARLESLIANGIPPAEGGA